jgi:Cu(I)/Ag(I) efflux system membrane fusion protein
MKNKLSRRVVLPFLVGISIQFGCEKDRSSEINESRHTMAHEEERTTLVHLDRHKVFHAGIRVETVTKKSLSIPLVLTGKVTFNEKRFSDVTALLGGRVDKVFLYVNDLVNAGDPMIELYSQEYLAMQYEALQAFRRLERASGDDVASAKSIYESIRNKLLITGVNETDVDRLEKTQVPETHFRVRAPFSGTVLRSEVTLGEMMEKGFELFEIADLTTVWVLADIYEKDLSLIQNGMPVTVEVVAYPDQFPGRITTIYSVVDPKSRTVKARVETPNTEGKLKPGMFCTVNVQTAMGDETIKIPSSALLGDTEDHFVFVATSDTTFQRRDIRTGAERRDLTEVLDGLIEGESIVVKGGFFLKSELAKETFAEEH